MPSPFAYPGYYTTDLFPSRALGAAFLLALLCAAILVLCGGSAWLERRRMRRVPAERTQPVYVRSRMSPQSGHVRVLGTTSPDQPPPPTPTLPPAPRVTSVFVRAMEAQPDPVAVVPSAELLAALGATLGLPELPRLRTCPFCHGVPQPSDILTPCEAHLDKFLIAYRTLEAITLHAALPLLMDVPEELCPKEVPYGWPQ